MRLLYLFVTLKNASSDRYEQLRPIDLAVRNTRGTDQTSLARVFDTLRHLFDSIDFSERIDHGYRILIDLVENASVVGGDAEVKLILADKMLKLSSSELKMFPLSQYGYVSLLNILLPIEKTFETADYVLNLGGTDVLNALSDGVDGYTLLHYNLVYGDLIENWLLPKGPDLHKQGLDTDLTPQWESPMSLAMYTSLWFICWTQKLEEAGVVLKEFAELEMDRNLALYPGWKKQTLHALLESASSLDIDCPDSVHCHECGQAYWSRAVEPRWRYFLEGVKHGLSPYTAQTVLQDNDEEDEQLSRQKENVTSSYKPRPQADSFENAFDNVSELSIEMSNGPGLNQDSEEDPLSLGKDADENRERPPCDPVKEKIESVPLAGDIHGYPATMQTGYRCPYDSSDVICMDCWQNFVLTGHRRLQEADKDRLSDECSSDEYCSSKDESSEDQYSPFYIHS